MRRRLFLLGFALCAALAACAPVMVAQQGAAAVVYKTVRTPTGPLRLAVTESGRGKPILLLHGFATSSYTWQGIMPHLARKNRVIAVDLRGFGASDKPLDDKYSVFDQADVIQAFIEQEKLKDLTIVGHSFGGGVTLALALRAKGVLRSRIRNIVLVDSVAYKQPLPIFFRMLQVPGLAEVGMALVPPEVQSAQGLKLAYYDHEKITERAITEYASPLHSPAAKHALVKTVEQIMPPNIDEIALSYRTIRVPTLVVWCQEDKVVPSVFGQRLKADIPTAELVMFSKCGHMPQEEKPAETARAIEAFLARH
ncbi:alpha/beta hydrolase [Rhodomicrobium sp. Az07]|uniref:alpha/beta hydrolase n=1 Tax=Rhodomicrobium sp. Az07 TaxID=2839034 RepID=UPI001BE5AA5C|nr:alpha/beta hydrolase [Rhodomicrobium sp. Az07]MBT3069701.1 alpha/beta hydrolase [Rhodomicrobium sp. Az07]